MHFIRKHPMRVHIYATSYIFVLSSSPIYFFALRCIFELSYRVQFLLVCFSASFTILIIALYYSMFMCGCCWIDHACMLGKTVQSIKFLGDLEASNDSLDSQNKLNPTFTSQPLHVIKVVHCGFADTHIDMCIMFMVLCDQEDLQVNHYMLSKLFTVDLKTPTLICVLCLWFYVTRRIYFIAV